MATILNAWTGPSLATSCFNVSLTNRCRAIGVRDALNFSEITITLKWVSELAGLYVVHCASLIEEDVDMG